MRGQPVSLVLSGLLLCAASAGHAFAQTTAADPTAAEKDARLAEEVKQNIPRLGTGREARVMVKLRDKRKVAGYVSQVGADSFTLVDERTGAPTEVAYAQVRRISAGNRTTRAFFSLPRPEPREPPKWLKAVGRGAEVAAGVAGAILLMTRF